MPRGSFSNMVLVSFSEGTRKADHAARVECQGMKLKNHMLVTGLVSAVRPLIAFKRKTIQSCSFPKQTK